MNSKLPSDRLAQQLLAEHILLDNCRQWEPNDGVATVVPGVMPGQVAHWRYRFRYAALTLGFRLLMRQRVEADGTVTLLVKGFPKDLPTNLLVRVDFPAEQA